MATSKRENAVQEKSTIGAISFNDDLALVRSYTEPTTKAESPVEPRYKSTVSVVRPAPVKTVRPAPEVSVSKKPIVEPEVKQEVARETLLTPAMKRALITYLAIVVLLTAAVIATGVFASSLATQVSEAATVVDELSQVVALQEVSLESLASADIIADLASGLGMTESSSVVTSASVEIIEAQSSTATNWFDTFCNWISGMLGG